MQLAQRLWAVFGLGAVGFLISSYQTLHYYALHGGRAEFKSFCSVGSFNCEAVELSSYASLLGLPLSGFAAGWFMTLIILSWRSMSRSDEDNQKGNFPFIKLMGLGGLLVSAFYLFIMVAVIKQYCFLCLGVDTINLLIFLLSLGLSGSLGSIFSNLAGFKSQLITFAIASLVVVGVFYLNNFAHEQTPKSDRVGQIVEETLASPTLNISLDGVLMQKGNPEAPVTIVKYSDFECPACRRGAQVMHTILMKYPKQVRLVYKNFPLDNQCNREMQQALHVHACAAARAAYCAAKQNKFNDAYELLFENQNTLSKTLEEFPINMGLEKEQYQQCLADPATQEAIQKDISEAVNLNISGTPTFYINGHKLVRSDLVQVWSALIEKLVRQ